MSPDHIRAHKQGERGSKENGEDDDFFQAGATGKQEDETSIATDPAKQSQVPPPTTVGRIST